MNSICERIRDLLAAEGPRGLRDDREAEEHLVECAGCLEALESMVELDRVFDAMPAYDAPDEVVDGLLAREEIQAGVDTRSGTADKDRETHWRRLLIAMKRVLGLIAPARRRWRYAAVPAMLVIGGIVVIQVSKLGQQDVLTQAEKNQYRMEQLRARGTPPPDPAAREKSTESGGLRYNILKSVRSGSRAAPSRKPTSSESDRSDRDNESGAVQDRVSKQEGKEDLSRKLADARVKGKDAPEEWTKSSVVGDEAGVSGRRSSSDAMIVSATEKIVDVEESRPLEAPVEENLVLGVPDVPLPPESGLGGKSRQASNAPSPVVRNEEERFRDQIRELEKLGESKEATLTREQLDDLKKTVDEDEGIPETEAEAGEYEPADKYSELTSVSTGRAAAFLAERDSLEHLSFKQPRGYWANTYIPGDRELRRLQHRLDGRDRSNLERLAGASLTLHDRSGLAPQPFDPPDDAAVAVFLKSDRSALDSRTRLLLEVGLKGTPRHSGARTAMNLGVVLDMRGEISDEVESSMRALLDALLDAHDLGDRFSLTVAGRPGGLIVPAERFRHGPVMIALNDVLGGETSEGHALSPAEAVEAAIETVTEGDDPGAPLGSSMVLLVTSQPLESSLDRMIRLAQTSSVAGIPMSVVGIGTEVRIGEIDSLVLAGQGNRRLLSTAGEASGLIERELEAVGRVVARALRLRIRLAAGVQLIDVLGSHRYDEESAQLVREAENAIDRRLARNLGITADRGLDEEGIQIVIPSFYANDEHVILLDLVAPGPGPIADVSARFKDLVWMKNGVASAHLSLPRGLAEPGPLQRNVIKNLLSRHLGEALQNAADFVAAERTQQAVELLTDIRQLLLELPDELPGFQGDRDLRVDVEMLSEYIALLEVDQQAITAERDYIVDSLRYAGRLQVMRRPFTESD